MSLRIIFCVTAFLICVLCSTSAFAYPVKITNGKDSVNIGLSVEYFEDKHSSLTLKDIIKLNNNNKFSTTTKVPLNFGYSKATYWVSFSVLGDTYSDSGWLLDLPYAPLDYITLYIPNGKGDYIEYRNGDKVPFAVKHIEYKNAVFLLGQNLIPYQEYYLRVSSEGSINVPLFLWTGAGFAEHINIVQSAMGMYFGILMALAIYNLFLYASVRDRDFALCSFAIISYTLVQGSYYGLAGQFLWPNLIWWSNISLLIFAILLFFSIAVFTRSFLNLIHNSKRFYKILSFFIYFYAALFPGSFLLGYRVASIITATMGIILILFVFMAALFVYARGYKPARFMLLAWTVFLMGMLLLLLKLLGVLPHVFITEYSVHIGFILNSMLLSFALSDKVNMLRQEKDQAQQEALAHLEESEKMKTIFLEETEKLVDERTMELENVNAKLMELASIDVLTGLSNRRVFNEGIEKEFKRAKRVEAEISIIIVDVDYFKNYNDYYGHLKGDVVLAELAEIFRFSTNRSTDILARYGGEEFALVLSDTNEEGAMMIAESLREKVEKARISHKVSPIGFVTVSCGVASLKPSMQDRLEDFINMADQALYKAKNAGRNKVIKSSL